MILKEDTSGFIRKLFMRHVWPGVAAQVVSTIGPIVCSVIAGTVFGKPGLAVIGLYAPFFFFAGFCGTIIAGGSAALAAKYIAQNDDRRVSEIYSMALISAAACAAVIFALGMLFRYPIISILSGNGELMEPAARYFMPSLLYTCLTVIVFIPLFWARLIGRPSVALVLTLVLTGASIALGFLYTFALEMGLESLASAQAYATALAITVSLAMIHLPKNGLRLQIPRHFREDAPAMISIGSPPGLSRLYRFLSLFIVNFILLNFIGADAVAVFGVLNMLLRFTTAFSNGISGVQMPIAGVLREERDITSLRQLARITFLFGNTGIIIAALMMIVFNRQLADIFGVSGTMFFIALVCFCIYIPFYLNGGLVISWYTAVRKVKLANIIAIAQDMILPPLFAVLLAIPGDNMIWLHLPAAGIITGLLLVLTRRCGRADIESNDTALSFSVERSAEKAGEASSAVADFCDEQGLERRQSMLLSMAIEELIILLAEHNSDGGDISVRLIQFDGGIVLRLRDTGQKFDPISFYKKMSDDAESIEASVDLMGVKYITEAAEVVYYRETFGVNNLVVII